MVSGMLVSRESIMFCISSCRPGVWNKSSCVFRSIRTCTPIIFLPGELLLNLTWSQAFVYRWLIRIHTSLGIFRGFSSEPVPSTVRKFTFDLSWGHKSLVCKKPEREGSAVKSPILGCMYKARKLAYVQTQESMYALLPCHTLINMHISINRVGFPSRHFKTLRMWLIT